MTANSHAIPISLVIPCVRRQRLISVGPGERKWAHQCDDSSYLIAFITSSLGRVVQCGCAEPLSSFNDKTLKAMLPVYVYFTTTGSLIYATWRDRSFSLCRIRAQGMSTGPLLTTFNFQSCARVPARRSLPAT